MRSDAKIAHIAALVMMAVPQPALARWIGGSSGIKIAAMLCGGGSAPINIPTDGSKRDKQQDCAQICHFSRPRKAAQTPEPTPA